MSKTACSYCNRPSFDRIPTPDQTQKRSREEINQLHAKIRQLDESVAELSRMRAALLEELNHVQPQISVLPQEILSVIFQFAFPPPKFGAFPPKDNNTIFGGVEGADYSWFKIYRTLNNVSTHWRRTLASTPDLWTNVDLHIQDGPLETYKTFLPQFLKNSGDLPLNLSFHFPEYIDLDDDILIHPTVDTLLLDNFARIKNLHLTFPPPAWFLRSLAHFEQLTHCSLENAHDSSLHLSLDRMPLVSELTLIGNPVVLPSPCLITVLNLSRIPLNAAFRMITSCPNLIELHIRAPGYIWDPDTSYPVETFTLPRLEVLDWVALSVTGTILDIPWEVSLMNHIHVPSLRALSWIHAVAMAIGRPPEIRRAMASFFTRLPLTLTTLEFVKIRDEPNTQEDGLLGVINDNLHDDCHIESLIFTDCSSQFLAGILRKLTPQRTNAAPRFPRLREITMDGTFWPMEFIGNREQQRQDAETLLSQVFLKMVEKRIGVSDERFALHLKHASASGWLMQIRNKLVKLMKRHGSRLEIFIDSEPVTWLS